MWNLSECVPPSFFALALAHFMALISPGPDFFLVLGHAVRGRLRGAIFLCTGIAFGNAVYIALAAAGWTALRQSPELYRGLELVGAAYLFWLGRAMVRAAAAAGGEQDLEGKLFDPAFSGPCPAKRPVMLPSGALPAWQPFLAGLGSALLNPKNAIFYLTLMTVILGPEVTPVQQLLAGVWMTTLVFAWDAGLAAAVSHSRVRRLLGRQIPLMERLAGWVLMLLAISFVLLPVIQGNS